MAYFAVLILIIKRKGYIIKGHIVKIKLYNSLLVVSVLIMLFGCSSYQEKAEAMLQQAGSNKQELQRVIEHYKTIGEKQKLKAACYLIANMEDKYTDWSTGIEVYFQQLKRITSLKGGRVDRDSMDQLMRVRIDSLSQLQRPGGIEQSQKTGDLNSIKADFLIKNIDLAFEAWHQPWAQHLNFDEFCEYILPYRIHHEPLSNWREQFYKQFISFGDSVSDPSDPRQLVEKISNYVYAHWTHLDNFTSYNYYPSLVEMAECNGGLCDHRYFLITAIMRSIGLPVTIDCTPQWTNYTGGHAWNVLLDKDGRMRPFNGGEDNFRFYDQNLIPMGDGGSICTKVYRQMFSQQPTSFPLQCNEQPLNALFNDRCLMDVTGEYDFPKTHFKLQIDDEKLEGKVVYLTVFNYGWDTNHVGWAKVDGGEADFGYIGLPAFYIPTTYQYGQISMVHSPMVMYKEDEKRCEYEPSLMHKQSVRLFRKFCLSGEFIQFSQGFIGCKIQGSDTPDFKEAEDICTIKDATKAWGEIQLNAKRPFRYIRLLSSDSSDVRLAELEFLGKDQPNGSEHLLQGKVIGYSAGTDKDNNAQFGNAFDKSIRSNLNMRRGSWVGLDLGDQCEYTLSKICYLPRNNYNVIEPGHVYELFCLTDRWVSLGRQQATKHYLAYDNVPQNALLLLKDLSGGRQERIFMYDAASNEQVWW